MSEQIIDTRSQPQAYRTYPSSINKLHRIPRTLYSYYYNYLPFGVLSPEEEWAVNAFNLIIFGSILYFTIWNLPRIIAQTHYFIQFVCSNILTSLNLIFSTYVIGRNTIGKKEEK